MDLSKFRDSIKKYWVMSHIIYIYIERERELYKILKFIYKYIYIYILFQLKIVSYTKFYKNDHINYIY